MASCVKCSGAFENVKDALVCCECKGSFHPTCTPVESLENLKRNKRSAWVCDTCKSESSSSASRGDKESGALMEFMKKMEANLSSQIARVNESVGGVKVQLESVQKSVATMDVTLKSLITENEIRKEEYERVCKENEEMKRGMEEVTERVRDLEQYSRRDNLEIVGIPYTKGENVYLIIDGLAKVLRLPFNRSDLSVAHRLPVSKTRPHPNIIAKFVSRECKNAFLTAAKQFKKNLTAAEMSDTWPSTPIFINEHLTTHNKAVLGRAKGLVKEKKLAHAWAREGKVFARRTWDSTCPITLLRSQDDVEKLAVTK